MTDTTEPDEELDEDPADWPLPVTYQGQHRQTPPGPNLFVGLILIAFGLILLAAAVGVVLILLGV
jgi:hypothetical protein